MQLLLMTMKLFYFVFVLTHKKSQCSGHKDHLTCTNNETWSQQSCMWCPMDQTFHEGFSLENICKSQTAAQAARHEAKNYGNFSYNADEAYKLALFSAIAYSDEPGKCLRALFPQSDYSLFYVLLRKCDDYLFTYDKQCLAFATLSHRHQEIIVAYCGTRGVEQIIDQVLVTLGTVLVPSATGGKVQRYFNNVHKKLYHNIKHLIIDLIQGFPKYTVKLTGHSLGGAAASITSARLVRDKVLKPEQVLLYTFGMPRVGNKQYATAHDRLLPNSWRIVRKGDIVAKLPFCILGLCSIHNEPHHHGTKVLYTGTKMDRHSDYVIFDGDNDSHSKCTETRKKRVAVKNLTKKHKLYFGIPIGTYCRDFILKNKGP